MNHFQLINDKRLLGSALACLGLLAAAPSAFATASPLPMAQAGQAVITASGVVEDAAGPLIGATVMEKGTTDHGHHPGKRYLGIIVGLHHGIGFRNLQLLDIQVKIQEEIGHKDRTSPNDTNDN